MAEVRRELATYGYSLHLIAPGGARGCVLIGVKQGWRWVRGGD